MEYEHDLRETIIAALMTRQPIIIVEGQDDIKFYDNIAENAGLSVMVQAVETISGYTEGCEQVCMAMEDATALFQNDSRLKKYAIGIIDRDVRQYLNALPANDSLLVLKYYSYETHLITDRTIKNLLSQLTKAPATLITKEAIDWIKEGFYEYSEKLYYFSLEALKARCDNTYQADITYGTSWGAVTGKGRRDNWRLIEPKVNDLDSFAALYHVSLKDLKYIAKGKWFLEAWCDYLLDKVKNLHSECGVHLPKCGYCKVGIHQKCLWRFSAAFQAPMVRSVLQSFKYIDMDEVAYIVDFIKHKLAC